MTPPSIDDTEVDSPVHVYPVFDGREHVCVGYTCWCDPQPDVENSNVIIHNPMH